MSDFASRDPRDPAFWDERFARGFTPWDRGAVPADLQRFAATEAPLRTLIPGCGTAWELDYLCALGWEVDAIDFAPEAVAQARARHPRWAVRLHEADFFAWQPAAPLELIYERAFLCAMPRARWPEVVARWAALLPPGGQLAGFFFFDAAPKGPPFGADPAVLQALLQPHFRLEEDGPVADSIPVFAGKERWQRWRRR
ncbi:methyltransferase domain-containing protein [Massilia sp. TS11]|uniref:methyltransferase domain-containing protein n=1 Tax=Massilia sp. TS11 TaxID=2908003 RepID=UPI001EDB946A|nr:methyltransferase domain-containing protein [Massilia sp. TS11]MCG2584982.1 TPMT family class I SAM-dependent methyltransferase [Massilia sp. TS11]